MVGPFIFRSFGPVQFPPGRGIDVRPHPHIGLALHHHLFEAGKSTATAWQRAGSFRATSIG
jgi:redox-sensitive bicupin YhaK (pirin superfamily)